MFESLETRTLLAADLRTGAVWQNPLVPGDVNNDSVITPADVISLVDELNRSGIRQLESRSGDLIVRASSATQTPTKEQYWDVNGDGILSPADLVRTIEMVNNAAGDPDTVTVTSQVFDLGGNPITEILQGTHFYVGLVAEDTRPNPVGILSAYADVAVNDTNLVDLGVDPLVGSAQLRFNPPAPMNTVPVAFNSVRTGTLQDSNPVIQGAGAANGPTPPTAPDPVTVWTATFVAAQSGLAEFTPSTSTGFQDEILPYDRQSPNSPTVVTFLPSSVTIVSAAAPTLSIASNSALETAGSIVFDVTLTAGADPITRDVYVVYSTSNGTAFAGSDYDARTSQTLTFAVGTTTQQIVVQVQDDDLFEGDENFDVNLLFASNALIDANAGVAIGTIIDDEVAPELIILDPAPVVEGDIGENKTMTFTVQLSTALTQTVEVGFASQNISATSGADYVAVAGQLTFLPGETEKTIDVTILGDLVVEGEETFLVRITSVTPTSVVIKDDQAVGRIIDNDAPVGFSVSDVQTLEGDAGQTSLVFTVTLNTPLLNQATVQYATSAGTATSGVDYLPTSGVLTFAPGQTSKTVTVQVVGDTDVEPDEDFSLVLSNPVGTLILDSSAFGIILDDDGNNPVQMQFRFEARDTGNNVVNSVLVGDNFTLQVYVDDLTQADQGVLAAYLDMLYSAGLIDVTGPLVFNPTYGSVQSGNTAVDGFVDNLGATDGPNPLGAAEQLLVSIPMIATAGGTATFTGQPASQDVDAALATTLYGSGGVPVPLNQIDFGFLSLDIIESLEDSFTINSVTQLEGNDPNLTQYVFTVTRNNSTGSLATVEFATSNGTATVADNDYQPTSGTLTFSGATTTQTITVTVVGDNRFEADENFLVTLSNATGGPTISGTGVGVGTITNDDEPIVAGVFGKVYVDANDSGVQDANEPGIGGVIITVRNQAGTFEQYTVTAADGSFGFNNLPEDKYFVIQTQPGFYIDGRETPENLRALDGGGAVINDTFFVDLGVNPNVQLRFGERGIKTEFLAAWLNRRMFFSTTTDGALNGVYTPIVNMNLQQGDVWVSFDAGWDGLRKFQMYADAALGTANISLWQFDRRGNLVQIASPTTVNGIPEIAFNGEPGKNYFLKISGTNTNASVRVIDTVRAVAKQVAEGTGSTTYQVEVKLSARQTGEVVVNYATANDTAIAGTSGDYTATSGTLTFAAGETSKLIDVTVLGDALDEDDETFAVNLSTSATFVEIAPGPFLVTILDDDPTVRLTINSTSLQEGAAGTRTASFLVVLSEASGRPVTVVYQTQDGTARAGADYTAVSGTLTFAPGTRAQFITVPILGDQFVEADETFRVVLSSPTNANILLGVGNGTIVNDDNGPQFIPLGGGVSSGLASSVEYSAIDAAFADEEDWLLSA